MRSKTQIKQRLKQVVYRHFQKRVRVGYKHGAATCRHNVSYDLDESGESWIGRCGLVGPDGIPRGVVCDERIDGDAVAKECPFWEPSVTKDEIRAEFESVVKGEDRGPLAVQFPDVAVLMWVLDDPSDPEPSPEIPSVEEAGLSDTEMGTPATWWRKGLLGRVLGTDGGTDE